jgi:uncharacterized membrane protein
MKRFLADEAGNMSVLFAVAMVLGSVFGALAIDEASLYGERRQMQSAVDLAALAAATDPDSGQSRAETALADAGFAETPVVEAGHYEPDPNLAVGERFAVGEAPFNAVRVALRRQGTLYFARSWSVPPAIGVEAVATAQPYVAFSVGSRLARLEGGVANAVLNALLGADISLSAVDYNGLIDADVDLFAFLDALATELDISAGTYADVLAARADSGQIAAALADVLDGSERAAATVLAEGLGGNGTLPVGKLISLGAWAQKSIGNGLGATFANVSALELLAASAALSDGTHQLALNLGASVPGLVGIATTLEIGEPPQGAGFYAFGPSGTLVRTAQVRLKFLATLGGGATLLNSGVKLPLSLEIASAEAGVESGTCPSEGQENGSARIWVKPGIAKLLLGDAGSSRIVNVAGLLTVDATAPVELVSPTRQIVTFKPAEIAAGKTETVQTSGFVQGMVAGLVGGLDLDIRVLGLGLLPKAALDAAIRTLLAPLAPVLDKTIDMLLATLGLKLGEADVRVYAVTCGAPVLVR